MIRKTKSTDPIEHVSAIEHAPLLKAAAITSTPSSIALYNVVNHSLNARVAEHVTAPP
ncbi:MAG: hypothetical protein ACJASL_004448 [Paraglaciecola sp.]|jgi:hypothetical protein